MMTMNPYGRGHDSDNYEHLARELCKAVDAHRRGEDIGDVRSLARVVQRVNAHLPAERRIDPPAGYHATATRPSTPRSSGKPTGQPGEAAFLRRGATRVRDDRDLDRLLRGRT
jgi:hypothetical protein